MSHQIRDTFYALAPVTMTSALANAIIKFVEGFETKNQHPQALNTYMLGVYPCYFTEHDSSCFLNLFHTDTRDLNNVLKKFCKGPSLFGVSANTIPEDVDPDALSTRQIKAAMRSVSAINEKFRVISDPFNLFCTYAIHKILTGDIPQRLKDSASMSVMMLLQYKFFTSLVNHRFPYKPDEAIMTAMYESLSNKFDIRVYGTWRIVLQVRATQMLDPDGVHGHVLEHYDDDKEILYFISSAQTRIRQNLNTITSAYMAAKENHDRIATYSAVGTDEEGKKVLLDNAAVVDNMCITAYAALLSTSKLLDDKLIRMFSGIFLNVTPSPFRAFLISVSEYAVRMQRSGKSQATKKMEGQEILIGPEIFVNELIQRSYRFCITSEVSFSKPALVLSTLKAAFNSSRISDPSILQLRATAEWYVKEFQTSRREVTVSAFKTAFLLYITMIGLRSVS